MGRKGCQKFFDISLDWLDPNRRAMFKRTQNSKEHQALRDVIIGPVEDAFDKNMKVQVLKTNKANGEMCQISYCKPLKAWIICSKNVAMPCRSMEDLHLFKGMRYSFSNEIGVVWFKLLKRMGVDKIKELSEYLSTRTILGE